MVLAAKDRRSLVSDVSITSGVSTTAASQSLSPQWKADSQDVSADRVRADEAASQQAQKLSKAKKLSEERPQKLSKAEKLYDADTELIRVKQALKQLQGTTQMLVQKELQVLDQLCWLEDAQIATSQLEAGVSSKAAGALIRRERRSLSAEAKCASQQLIRVRKSLGKKA